MQQTDATKPFQGARSGRVYRQRRYRGVFQRLVAWREQRLASVLLSVPHAGCNGHIVDLPCGYGRFLPLLRRRDFRVTGMDQSQAMVDLYRQDEAFRDGRDHAERADVLEPLPVGAASARRVLCVRLFQHLHHGELRIRALKTLANNRRQIVMTYYDDACLHYWTKRAVMRLKGRKVRVKMIPRRLFESEVAAAGLRVIKRVKLFPGVHAQTWVVLAPAGNE
ncbi:class I SAM-dependent methyltransferase [Salinisphaera sp. T31B1]|uniref:class I SAM-dependent methyltransferase n=1 Tax=Salinisphaera sp. T31B1 TaxID=727963 RepID=UPI00333E95A9